MISKPMASLAVLVFASVSLAAEPEVARMFRARCAACHAIPDLSLRTDRAWLGQVRETS